MSNCQAHTRLARCDRKRRVRYLLQVTVHPAGRRRWPRRGLEKASHVRFADTDAHAFECTTEAKLATEALGFAGRNRGTHVAETCHNLATCSFWCPADCITRKNELKYNYSSCGQGRIPLSD